MDGDIIDAWRQTGAPVFSRLGVNVNPLFVGDFVASHQDTFLAQMAGWLRSGHIQFREDVSLGLPSAPAAFGAMLAGNNFGKTLVKVSPDPAR
jgi:NADPH-dependent curcumin reductase CurA